MVSVVSPGDADPLAHAPDGIPILARGSSPRVMVYAAAVGLAGAIPVPILDSVMSELARGAAMRRVAQRHGVSLTSDARSVLAGTGALVATSNDRARWLKTALASALAPFRVAARLEDALGTLAAAVLLDRYFRRAKRPSGSTLSAAEARNIRAAVERAIADTGIDLVKDVPIGVFDLFSEAFSATVRPDSEGRNPVERFVDAMLDGLADAPTDLVSRLSRHFDEAYEEGSGAAGTLIE